MSLDNGHSVRSFSGAGNRDDIFPFRYKACITGLHNDLNADLYALAEQSQRLGDNIAQIDTLMLFHEGCLDPSTQNGSSKNFDTKTGQLLSRFSRAFIQIWACIADVMGDRHH